MSLLKLQDLGKIYVSDGNKIKIQLMYDDPYKSIMDYLKKVEVLGNVG